MSNPFNRTRWAVVSPYLDHALDLADEERPEWLATLRAQDATLATEIASLLDEHNVLDEEGFLDDPPSRQLPASLTGQAFGAWTLRREIGQGGMGTVWLAERNDGRFQGFAAVKLLNASLVGLDGEARFRREGTFLARLRHPHIAQLIDAGVSPGGQPYLVLEHVDGEHIDRHCAARQMGTDARIRLFLDVLAAVAHAHVNLIVHRDIKPSNVLVGRDGAVKLLDFGIAKLLDGDVPGEASTLTRDGQSALTPEYAAPEQLTGGHVTTVTDVYALGVLLYILLSGQHPAGPGLKTPVELVNAIVETEARRLSEAARDARLRAALQGDLDNIVGKALQKRPQDRYPSVEALAADLRRYLRDEPVNARRGSIRYRTAKFVRRNRTAVDLGTLALLALLAGLGGTVSQARRAQAQAARADREARVASEQRDFALRQLSRAEAINELDSFLLSDAAALGKPFTVGDLLARAERTVERQADEAGENRIHLLVAIGRQYHVQDEAEKARQVLTKAYELSRDSPERATRAAASCALASSVAAGGQSERSERLYQEGLAELPDEPQFALHRSFCLLRGSEVARRRSDGGAAVERAEAAQRLARESRFASALLGLRASMDVAESYRVAGRNQDAVDAFADAFRRLSSLGRGDTETAGTLLNNWGVTLRMLGRTLAAERLFRRALDISSAGGAGETVSPMLLYNLARTLEDLARLPEAAGYAERAYSKARRSGSDVIINYSLMARVAIYRQRGDLRRSAAALSELEPRLPRLWPANHLAYAVAMSERSELALARGDKDGAQSAADRAVALAEGCTSPGAFLHRALLRRSQLRLRLGELDGATADAREALRVALAATPPGSYSSHVGLAHLGLGRALQAQGKLNEAHAAFAGAAEHLQPTLGKAHPATRSAEQLAASVTRVTAR